MEGKLTKNPTHKQLQDALVPYMNCVMATAGNIIIKKTYNRTSKSVVYEMFGPDKLKTVWPPQPSQPPQPPEVANSRLIQI